MYELTTIDKILSSIVNLITPKEHCNINENTTQTRQEVKLARMESVKPSEEEQSETLSTILYESVTRTSNAEERYSLISGYMIWAIFHNNINSNDDYDIVEFTEWLRICSNLFGKDFSVVDAEDAIARRFSSDQYLLVLDHPTCLYKIFQTVTGISEQGLTPKEICEINLELDKFYSTLIKCVKDCSLPIISGSMKLTIPSDCYELYKIMDNKLVRSKNISPLLTNPSTSSPVAIRKQQQVSPNHEAIISRDDLLSPAHETCIPKSRYNLMDKYSTEVMSFYPPPPVPVGSVCGLVDLEFYQMRIQTDWSKEDYQAYSDLIQQAKFNEAWYLIDTYVKNHLLSIIPDAEQRMGRVESSAVNKIVELLKQSPLLAEPIQELQDVVASLAGLEKQLTSLVINSSQGK